MFISFIFQPSAVTFIDNPKVLSDGLKKSLSVLEDALTSSPFLIDKATSVADICVWSSLYPLLSDSKLKPMFSSYTHIFSWYESIAKLTQVQVSFAIKFSFVVTEGFIFFKKPPRGLLHKNSPKTTKRLKKKNMTHNRVVEKTPQSKKLT